MSEYKCIPICGPFNLGEAPHWQHRNGSLYFVDAWAGDVCKFHESSKQLERKHIGGCVTIIIPREENEDKFIVSKGQELLQFEWSTGITKSITFVEQDSPTHFNDGKCDRNGRLWIGTMGFETSPAVVTPDLGSLYCINKDYTVKRCVKNVSLSNGIAWSADNKLLYFADSAKRKVYVFDYHSSEGDVSNQRVFVDYEKQCKIGENPDGITVDTSGKVWVANWDGERVIRVDPETAQIISEVTIDN
ncbi:hypothetical protein B4U80_09181, partial [Leptotrombidium deliense]